MAMRELLANEREELVWLDERVKRFDAQLDAFAREDQACRRLQTIPGVGPKIASALVAAAGDAKEFGSAREFAAWLGLTPRQRSTGGRTVLGGVSKRGDRYLRSLLIHGARAALRMAPKREDRRSRWAVSVHGRRGANIAAVARWRTRTRAPRGRCSGANTTITLSRRRRAMTRGRSGRAGVEAFAKEGRS